MQKRKTHRGYLPRWVFLRLDRLLVLKRCTYAEHDGLRDAEALVSPFVYLLGSVHDLYPLLIREQLADESRLPAPKGCNLFRRVMLLKK